MNLKLTKECRDWGLASWLVLAVVHQCLEFRTQEQRKSAQVHSSDWIWATSEYHNFWNQNFQLVSDTDLYNHSDLSAVTQHLLSHTRSSSCSSFTSQQCLEFGSFILQLIESSEFSFCLSTFTTLSEPDVSQHLMMTTKKMMTINQYSMREFHIDQILKRAWWNWISEFTQILKNSQVWTCEFCHSQNH
jgi:hypothetical protein